MDGGNRDVIPIEWDAPALGGGEWKTVVTTCVVQVVMVVCCVWWWYEGTGRGKDECTRVGECDWMKISGDEVENSSD